MIQFETVSKKFPSGASALEEVSFEISDGEFVFLVGPSGAGKTTIFKLIMREFPPTGGTIIVDEHDFKKLSGDKIVQLRRKVGCIFQDLKLLPDRSILENVALSLWVLGKKPADVESEAREKLGLVGLAEKVDLFPAQLSGGELQRAAIARALAGDPKYLLADEPTGNVDEENAWKIVDILKKINENGTTVVMATHNPDIIGKSKKRTIKLNNGKVVSDKK